MLPLLLTAVHSGRLTIEDIILRLHTNPCRIYGIPAADISSTYVEVDMDETWTYDSSGEETLSGALSDCGV